MNIYHVIKRDSVLNVTSNTRRKKGLNWFTQTKLGTKPHGSKCEIGDIAYIYIIDYGVVAKGKIKNKKISSVIVITHNSKDKYLNKILKEISKKNYIKRKPKLIRIDD